MSVWRSLLAALALAACATTSDAPEQPSGAPREPPVSQRVLTQLLEPPADNADLGGAHAQAYAMVGREDLAWTIPRISERPVCTPLLRDGEPIDPVAEIVTRAAEAHFVMLNEAHHDPHHRAFIAEIAERLRARGFSMLHGRDVQHHGRGPDRNVATHERRILLRRAHVWRTAAARA